MHTLVVISSAWRWHFGAIADCAALLIIFSASTGLRPRRAALWFLAGDLLLALVLCSPLDLLARNYLFTAEAIERLLLVFIVPYLLIRGLTEKMAQRLRLDRIAVPYAAAWSGGIGILSIWFLPRILDASLQNEALRRLEILTLVAGGAMFWWPLHSPVPRQRLRLMPTSLFYLAAATVWCSLLGLFWLSNSPGISHVTTIRSIR